MRKSGLLGTSALRSGVIVAMAFAAAPAFAQDTATAQTAAAAAAAQGDVAAENNEPAIVVTGTRIQTPGLVAPVPVTSVGGDEITQTGNVSLGDLLNDLPALRNTFSQGNSTAFIGTAGLNFLDLRGLGTQRTLVLQNGRRHVSATPGIARVDVNTIPTDLVQRIDIVTGGTSSIYGSDAVAGVVNFVLMNNFEGIRVRGQAGVSSRGDRPSYTASFTAGTNFAEGRGNVAISVEYNLAEALEIVDRADFTGSFRGRDQFQIFENIAGEPNGSDGIPDRVFLRGVRSLGLFEGGAFIASSSAGVSAITACSTGVAAACRANGSAAGSPRVFYFNENGILSEANYGLDLRGQTNNGTGNVLGGNGSTLRRYGQLQPYVERYGVNALGHFDLAEWLVPYFEAKWIRYDIEQEASPSFNTGGTQGQGTAAQQTQFAGLANSAGIPIQFDNPFLDPVARATIQSLLPAGSVAFRLQRNNLDLGIRQETGFRETWRGVFGIRGTFNDDWRYDISATYGEFTQEILSLNNRLNQRFRLSTDAVGNPAVGGVAGVAAGTPVCRSRLPGVVTPAPANPADAATLAADIAACVPVNLFGENRAGNQAAIDYFTADTLSTQLQNQTVISGYLSGDLSQLFELPGGPVGFAIGAEYRREDGFRDFGDLVVNGQTFLTAIARFRPPEAFSVKEAFGEINIPLLRDRPFFHELSLQGAARIADYSGATGTVLAWNAGATWSPVRDIRFRANYAVSVRAPTQFDLYAELGQNFATITDPCDVNFINNGSATRAANCLADGIPVGFINSPARSATIAISNGGNQFLTEETSRSLTIGMVFQPTFLPGFSLTADYYDIKVEDVIGAPTAQQIVNNCYDSATLNNGFCTAVRRDPGTRFFSSAAPEFGIVQGPINFAALRVRGIDFEARYRRNIPSLGTLDLRAVGTYVLDNFGNPFVGEPNRVDQFVLEVGDPRFQANFSASLRNGPFTLGYQLRYIGPQAIASVPAGGGIEDIRQIDNALNSPTNADFADVEFYSDAFYHDFRLGWEITREFNFYVGVDNAFDRLPQYGVLGNGSNFAADAIWDNIGRYFYAGAIVRF